MIPKDIDIVAVIHKGLSKSPSRIAKMRTTGFADLHDNQHNALREHLTHEDQRRILPHLRSHPRNAPAKWIERRRMSMSQQHGGYSA